jgi:hypothetical protein
MNSIEDLNNWGNTSVTYANAAAYAISFGANAGNVTTVVTEDSAPFALSKRVGINSISNAYQDVIIQFVANTNSSIANLVYTGTYANIWVQPNNAFTWTVRGIRDVNRYNEAWANVKLGLRRDAEQDFTLAVTVTDQAGNTRNWTETIDITAHNEYSVPASITFDEDTPANITGISVNDLASSTFTITVAAGNTSQGQIKYATVTANSHSISNTRANLNSILSANSFQFIPAADFVANSTILYTQVRNDDGVVQANAVPVTMAIGATHAEYAVPGSITYQEDTASNISGILINDVRPDRIDPSITYTITIAAGNTSQGLVRFANVSSSSHTITNTKSTVNSVLSANSFQFIPAADFTGTSSIRYTQIQNQANITQANAVSISMTNSATSGEYTLYSNTLPDGATLSTHATWYGQDTAQVLTGVASGSPLILQRTGDISITDARANLFPNTQYQVSFVMANTAQGNLFYRGGNVISSNITLTGTRTQINTVLSANIATDGIYLLPASRETGNIDVLYTQINTTDGITQAANVVIRAVCENATAPFGHTNYRVAAATIPNEFGSGNTYGYDNDQLAQIGTPTYNNGNNSNLAITAYTLRETWGQTPFTTAQYGNLPAIIPDKTFYTYVSANVGSAVGNLRTQNSNVANIYTFTGNKTDTNARINTLEFYGAANATANANLVVNVYDTTSGNIIMITDDTIIQAAEPLATNGQADYDLMYRGNLIYGNVSNVVVQLDYPDDRGLYRIIQRKGTGTPTAAATPDSGKVSSRFAFSGANVGGMFFTNSTVGNTGTAYQSVYSRPRQEQLPPRTVEAWIYPATYVTGGVDVELVQSRVLAAVGMPTIYLDGRTLIISAGDNFGIIDGEPLSGSFPWYWADSGGGTWQKLYTKHILGPTITFQDVGNAYNINNWTHVAVTRDDSNNITLYVNGTATGTHYEGWDFDLTQPVRANPRGNVITNISSTTGNAAIDSAYILGGASNKVLDAVTAGYTYQPLAGNTSATSGVPASAANVQHQLRGFRGFMDEVRISANVRYTGNFTPTTTQFESDANTIVVIHGLQSPRP